MHFLFNFFEYILAQVISTINKAEHAVQSYAAGKGNITTLSNTEQTRAMPSTTNTML